MMFDVLCLQLLVSANGMTARQVLLVGNQPLRFSAARWQLGIVVFLFLEILSGR